MADYRSCSGLADAMRSHTQRLDMCLRLLITTLRKLFNHNRQLKGPRYESSLASGIVG